MIMPFRMTRGEKGEKGSIEDKFKRDPFVAIFLKLLFCMPPFGYTQNLEKAFIL